LQEESTFEIDTEARAVEYREGPEQVAIVQRKTKGVASVESLVDGLAARLQENPDDTDGWALLARSYFYLGDTERAEAAKSKAIKLGFTGKIEPEINEVPSQSALPPNHPPLYGVMKNDAVMESLAELIESSP